MRTNLLGVYQLRNHTRAIVGGAWVEFISARAVASRESELGVLCLGIKPIMTVFRFKTAVYIFKYIGLPTASRRQNEYNITILNIHIYEPVIIM